MTVINGKKYISEDEFEKEVVNCLDELTTIAKKENAGITGVATTMLIMTEFAKLGALLFEKEEEKKDGRD